MKIFVTRNNQQRGPLDLGAIQSLLDAGKLHVNDLAWYEGAPGWIPLAQVPGIRVPQGTMPPPPPPSGQHIPNVNQGGQSTLDDAPNFLMALLGFWVPIAGIVLFFVDRKARPLRARSAGRGAALGISLQMATIFIAILLPVFSRASANAERASCQSNLKQAALGVKLFQQDNDENFPDLSTASAIENSMAKYMNPSAEYLKDSSVLKCPTTGTPFQGNSALSNVNESTMTDSSQTVLFYESDTPHMDGCNVAYADGHVKWFSAEGWEAEKERQGIS